MYVDHLGVGRELYPALFVFAAKLDYLKLKSAEGKASKVKEAREPLCDKRANDTVYAFALVELVPKVENSPEENFVA